jgi:tetratricopeptide (TPR) repeat protein
MKFAPLIIVAIAQILGGKPQPLTTPYQTEHAWAIGETSADIVEMAAAAKNVRGAMAPPPAGVLPWTPDAFVAFAKEQFGPASDRPAATVPDQYPALAQLTAAALTKSNEIVSTALRQNMRNVHAHESAALLLAAFGLREAADDLSDVRWTLNRITAHLAVADALRAPGAPPSLDGQLARVAFLALANRTQTALTALGSIEPRPTDQPFLSWIRALRLRLTDDWRTAAPVQGYRIEKLEYFRARRKTINSVRAGEELTSLKEPAAVDFARIVQSFPYGVEDGHAIVEPALGAELVEMSEVHRVVQRRDLPASVPAAVVNARAGRLMTESGPQVLPWGAWAEFFQRHIGMYVGEIDHFQRQLFGSEGRADQTKQQMDLLFGEWTLFPIASAKRTQGRGLEADLRYLNRAIDVAYRSPELVNYDYWAFLAKGVNYEVVKRGMPQRTAWFAAPPSAAVPYDAGVRARDMSGRLPQAAFEALVAEASSDVALHSRALYPRPNNQALAARVVAWFKERAAFDLVSIDAAVRWSRTLQEDIEWRQRGCALSIAQCVSLADLYAWAGDEGKAVVEYERAFKSPALDAVYMANSSNWLVRYYERTNQMQRAYDLAQRAADVGSAPGITTLARLYERRGRFDEAEQLYLQMALRYKRSSDEIAGFYYRQFIVAGKTAYAQRWRSVEKELFPNGLRKVPEKMPEQPVKGVFVYEDSATSRRVRLQAGDIIVGVDGWIVENKEQYNAVMAFSDPTDLHRLTAWRGILFTVELPENHGMDLQSYPLKGWIQ